MLTTEDLVKVSLIAIAASFIAPVVLGLIDHWRWQPPEFWTRFRRFIQSIRGGFPW